VLRAGLRDVAEAVSAEAGAAITRFTKALVAPIIELVGWEPREGDGPNMPLLRALVLRTAATCGSSDVVKRCLDLFDSASAGATIAADLRALVYNTVAAEGGESRWKIIRKLSCEASSSEEQRRLLAALGRSSSPALLSATLDMMLGACLLAQTAVCCVPTVQRASPTCGCCPGTEVRSQDAVFLIASVASNPGVAGRQLAWSFFKDNWEALRIRFGGGLESLRTRFTSVMALG
jgi:puromycin-sensitive aminopeptidase